jgi:hypothetical protein
VSANVWVKRALLLIIIGLVVQLFCVFDITPGRFMVFAGAGVGPVVLGWLLLAYGIFRARSGRTVAREPQDDA